MLSSSSFRGENLNLLLSGWRAIDAQSPHMENLNTPQELDRLKTTVLRQLQTLQGAPSMQMVEVRESERVLCVALSSMLYQTISGSFWMPVHDGVFSAW